MKHLETNKILTNLNHGFRSGYSCESQLLITINDFLKEHDKDHQVDVATSFIMTLSLDVVLFMMSTTAAMSVENNSLWFVKTVHHLSHLIFRQ
jgi:hypothetical protein